MEVKKIYQSLTTKEYGVHQGTTVDDVDGKIRHTLLVNGEERQVMDSTFRRWWKWVEETTPEDLNESLELLEQVKDTVLTKEPTIEDLKQLNESGEELTEEELQLFQQQAQQVKNEKEELEKSTPVVYELTTEDEKKPKPRKLEGVALLVKEIVESKGGEFCLYSEGRGGVVKTKGKPVMFFGLRKHGAVRLFMKEALDDALNCPYPVVESHSYPKQYPFRLDIKYNDDESKDLLTNIFDLYI